MEKIRIAYLISQYPAISHTFILREIIMLRHLGIDIQVASINTPDRPLERLTAIEHQEVLHTFYVKSQGILGALKAHLLTLSTSTLAYLRGLSYALRLGKWDLKKILYGFFYFVEAIMVGRWMFQHRLNHLHIHFPTAAASVGFIAHRIFPITYSMSVHGPDEFYGVAHQYLPQKILAADFICCISYFAQSQLMAWSPPQVWPRFEVVRLGVDPTLFAPRPFKESPSSVEILCVGRLVPVKGQFILIQAVATLIAQGRSLRLRLIGDGPDRAILEAEVAKQNLTSHILFEGAINQDAILTFYQQADIFALVSFAEGIPVVLMEAMMMEIPCISTHITGIPELIQHGEEGLLVPPSDLNSLIEAITRLIDDSSLRRKLGQAGRQKVLQHYELKRNTQQLADVFRRHLAP